jgi:hypothetical protein
LLGLLYFPFVFSLRGPRAPHARWALQHLLDIALVCAVFGIAQFLAQFFLHERWLFDFTPYLPSVMQGPSGYNTVIPVGAWYKSNGFFFREPSGFSFLMALALIAEWQLSRRAVRLLCYGLALLLTYSGTGILALLVATLVPFGAGTLLRLGGLSAAGGISWLVLGSTLNLSFTLERVQEFGSERSSAYIRYLAPLRLVRETFASELWTPWLGQGPGAIFRRAVGYEFHDPTWAKLLVEYGAIGALCFVTLVLGVLKQRELPLQVRATLFACWLVMGGHLLSPEVNFMLLALAGLLPEAAASAQNSLHAELGGVRS